MSLDREIRVVTILGLPHDPTVSLVVLVYHLEALWLLKE